jgi:glycine/D-amino acid oxidase-like deaminating enzyme
MTWILHSTSITFPLQVLQNCGVRGIQTYVDDYGTKRVKAVETDRGTINTKVVVNCAGEE